MIAPKKIEELKRLVAAAPATFTTRVEQGGPSALVRPAKVSTSWDNPAFAEFYRTAREALPALLAEREEMLAVLREVADHFLGEYGESCPICHEGGGYAGEEHAQGCRLAALLGDSTLGVMSVQRDQGDRE